MKEKKENIFLVGPMGAGKTSVARQLARQLHKTFHDSDAEIERQMGVSLSWIFDLEGMQGYRERERRVIDELSQHENIVLSTGGGCIETPEVQTYLKARGKVIYMEVTLEAQLNRLKKDKRRPQLQGENPNEVLIRLWNEREPIYEEIADFTIITDHYSVREVTDAILAWLKSN